jgi:hypothetical protein
MPNFEWVLISESDTENTYQIKNPASQFVKVCSPGANNQLNARLESHKQNLRVGFYLIKDIHQQKKYKSEINEDVARVSYKENPEKKFVDMGMSVRLQPLFNFVSECLNGNKLKFKKDPAGLVGEIIQVHSFELVDTTYNEQPTKVNKVKWSILNYQIPDEGILSDNELNTDFIDEDEMDPEEFFFEEDLDPEEYYLEDDLNLEEEIDLEDFLSREDFDPEEL